MKYLLSFIFISLLVLGCSMPEYPEFKKLENVKFKSASLEKMSVKLSANALFYNPNILGATISGMEFDVYANNKKVTTIKQNLSVPISAKSEFKLPIVFDIPLKDVFKDLKNNFTDIFKKKELLYKIDGNLTVNLGGTDISVPVTYEDTEEIKFLQPSGNIPIINFGK